MVVEEREGKGMYEEIVDVGLEEGAVFGRQWRGEGGGDKGDHLLQLVGMSDVE